MKRYLFAILIGLPAEISFIIITGFAAGKIVVIPAMGSRNNYCNQRILKVKKMTGDTAKKRDLVVTRVFNVPVSSVWKAWNDPDQVMKWWGPAGFTSPSCKMDFREGGTSLVCMRAPKEFGGKDMYNTWTYRKIVPMEFIEFILDWADKDGSRIDPASIGLPPDMPRDVRHVITFKKMGDTKTEMTITEFGYTSDQQFDLSKLGLEQCLDKMTASFAKD